MMHSGYISGACKDLCHAQQQIDTSVYVSFACAYTGSEQKQNYFASSQGPVSRKS